MGAKIRRPGWWMLFVLLIGMLGLILLESQDGVPNSVHEIIDGAIIVGFFGTLLGWMHYNQSALEQAESAHASLSEFHFVVYEPKQSAIARKHFADERFLVEEENPLMLTKTDMQS